MFRINARPSTRELLGEPVSSDWQARNARIAVSREISLHFYPQAGATTWSVITTDRQGHRRWDRTVATGDLSVGIEELAGESLADVLRILLREAVENLD